mmetsp:Transcript_127670/g.221361  ORF Transcript_127670/g.221361 Transcript_127670/m.221361 type:complete len:258 (-) Transcript_127670:1154-1927(-)
MDVDGHLWDEHRVHIELASDQAQSSVFTSALDQTSVDTCGGGCEVSAISAHNLVHNQHFWICSALIDNIRKVLGALLCRGERSKRLPEWVHVIVNSLWQANNSEIIATNLQESGKVSCCCVCVVATDGVQNFHTVLHQLVGSDLLRVLTLLDQPSVDTVLHIGQLHPAVANGTTTVKVEQSGVSSNIWCDLHGLSQQQALVPSDVADDLNRRVELIVSFDDASNSRRQARCETASCKQCDLLWKCHARGKTWRIRHW